MMIELNCDLVSFAVGEAVRVVVITCTAALFAGVSGWVVITRSPGADDGDWQSVVAHLPEDQTFDPDTDRIGRFELVFIPYPAAEAVALGKVG